MDMASPDEYRKWMLPDQPRRQRTLHHVRERLARESPQYYHQLKQDIAENGVQVPVLVRHEHGQTEVMDGHHRLSVADELGQHVPYGNYDEQHDYNAAADHPMAREWYRRRDELGERRASRVGFRQAVARPLYHGTSRDLTSVEPADRHGRGEVSTGLTRTDRAYATHDPQMARSYAEMSAIDTGGRARVYQVEHTGPAHALEPDPGYDADVRTPHSFRVLREVPEHELAKMPRHLGEHRMALVQGARYTPPTQRLFGPTFGLDARLWEGDKLRPAVREDVISRFDAFCHEYGYEGWHRWAKIVFFGSEASEWTSKALVGNGDFDLSIGIHYPALRAIVPGFEGLSDEIIAAGLTQEMHAELNDPQHRFPGVPGVFDMTWYANLQGWDIARIRPYAAYDVVAETWIVRPPHLPDWSMQNFPEGPGLAEEVRGIVEMAEGILAMPEPYRTQNGAALWEFVHSNRSDAFGPNGEGWWDARNVVEKALDQKGLMQKLWECHDRAQQAPESLAAPSDWSNSPIATR